jgi:DNA-directed RNA polymerase specialized sigma24 family protein
MEGYTQGEIAERLNVAERTIERKVRLIRAVWEAEAEKEITDLEPS